MSRSLVAASTLYAPTPQTNNDEPPPGQIRCRCNNGFIRIGGRAISCSNNDCSQRQQILRTR